MPNYDAALERVLEEAGGPSKVAQHLGIVASAVTQWTRVPARHVPRLEALTGIPGREIRPDLYPPPANDADAPEPTPAPKRPNRSVGAAATESPVKVEKAA
jgi:hypothetical protein